MLVQVQARGVQLERKEAALCLGAGSGGPKGDQALHGPGIEPGPPAWQARILPLNHPCTGGGRHPTQPQPALTSCPAGHWSPVGGELSHTLFAWSVHQGPDGAGSKGATRRRGCWIVVVVAAVAVPAGVCGKAEVSRAGEGPGVGAGRSGLAPVCPFSAAQARHAAANVARA